jgi:hypothetical protein
MVEIDFDPAFSEHPRAFAEVRRRAEAAMAELADVARDAHAEWREGGEAWPWHGYDLWMHWRISWSGNGHVSALNSISSYSGGAHPNRGFESLLWNALEASETGLADLFEDAADGSPAMTALHGAVIEDLLRQKREHLGEHFDEARERDLLLNGLAPAVDAFPSVTLAPSTEPEKAGGLLVYYGPYHVGSYVEGAYRVLVPQSLFAAHLAPDWAAHFGGEPNVDPAGFED